MAKILKPDGTIRFQIGDASFQYEPFYPEKDRLNEVEEDEVIGFDGEEEQCSIFLKTRNIYDIYGSGLCVVYEKEDCDDV